MLGLMRRSIARVLKVSDHLLLFAVSSCLAPTVEITTDGMVLTLFSRSQVAATSRLKLAVRVH
jgi:hypothetical protein